MEKKIFTIEELRKLLIEYSNDPYNHESCCFGKQDGDSDTIKDCDCEIYDLVEQFLLWVRDKGIGK